MLLFQKRFHEGLKSGAVTLTFRQWASPHVKVGGRYRCHPIGVLEVDAVEKVRLATITDEDARRTGFADRAELLAYLKELAPLTPRSELFKVTLHHGGDGDRVPLALEAAISKEERAEIAKTLARYDGETPWTRKTMLLIRQRPRVAASKLAKTLRRETLPFKEDVRKLKKLGLTQSFEVGYELSPRGQAYLGKPRK